jgi:hypothetical protein
MYEWIEGLFQYFLYYYGNDEILTAREAKQGLDFLYSIYSSSSMGKEAIRRLQPDDFRAFLKDFAWQDPAAFGFYLEEFLRPFDWVIIPKESKKKKGLKKSTTNSNK